MSKLDEFESNIEPTNNVEAKKFCQNTRKPSWG